MAQRRMLSRRITETDKFLSMPLSSQALYFHLNVGADDDGFIDKPRSIQRTIGASDDDLKLLIAKQFLIPFESGVVVIKDWRVHNYIQKDRYQPTLYQEEKNALFLDESGVYELKENPCIQNVSSLDTQVRLGKDRLELDNIYNAQVSAVEEVALTPQPDETVPQLGREVALTLELPGWLGEKAVEAVQGCKPKQQEACVPIAYLNQVTGSRFRFTDSNLRFVKARLKEGYGLDDFKQVVDTMMATWHGSDYQQYLRPQTLFGNNMDSYFNWQVKGERTRSTNVPEWAREPYVPRQATAEEKERLEAIRQKMMEDVP